MNIGYSLLIDEYADANQLESDDCDLLRVCCPVCFSPVELARSGAGTTLSHISPAVIEASADASCESSIPDFALEYRDEQNARARAQRIEFLHGGLFKELLNKDPVAEYEMDAAIILGKLKSLGAMDWLWEWHLAMVVDAYSLRLSDKVEFWRDGERHLAQFGSRLSHIPLAGYGRQVQFQIAYDLMQYLLSRKGPAEDDYSWLFTHAFRLCTQKWGPEARLYENDEGEYPADAGAELRERIAAARIIVSCCCDLLSREKGAHEKSMKILSELEAKPPLTSVVMPLLSFVGLEILDAMETTLFRLPYLPMLRLYERPCRPRVT